MSERAHGIHDHPELKLGKRVTDASRPQLRMGAHMRAAAYVRPAAVDYASRVDQWVLGANDQFGTCGPVSVANLALLVSTVLGEAPVRFTTEEVYDLYRRSGNPDFDPATGADDNGVDMTVLLSELVKGGIGFGPRNVRAIAYGQLNANDPEEMWSAAALFGGVLIGADLDQAQAEQFAAGVTWDHVSRSPDWGGHAMFAAPRYNDVAGTLADRTALVTWGKITDATDKFVRKHMPEAYAVIFPWHLRDRGFWTGLDLAGVAREFTALTGRPFPPVEPPPAPREAVLADFPFAELNAWASRPRGYKGSEKAAAAYNGWKRAHGLN